MRAKFSTITYWADCGTCEDRYVPNTEVFDAPESRVSCEIWARDHSRAHRRHLINVIRLWEPDGGQDCVARYQNGREV